MTCPRSHRQVQRKVGAESSSVSPPVRNESGGPYSPEVLGLVGEVGLTDHGYPAQLQSRQ